MKQKSNVYNSLLKTLETKTFISRSELAELDQLDDFNKSDSKLLDGRIKAARRLLALDGYVVHNVRMLGYRVALSKADFESELLKAITRAHGKTLESLRLHQNYSLVAKSIPMILDFEDELRELCDRLFVLKKKTQQLMGSGRSDREFALDNHAAEN